MTTPWLDFLAARGASMQDGAVQHFGQPLGESDALDGDIIADLSHLALLQVSGADAASFLQGQVTNDIQLLDGGNSQYAGYCMAKGRLLAVFLAFMHYGHYHLQFNGALGEQIAKRLRMYVLRSKVTIADSSNDVIRIGVAGSNTPAALQALFAEIPPAPHRLVNVQNATLIRLPGSAPRFEIITEPQHAESIWSQLQASCTPVGRPGWDWLDIRAGIPVITPATQEAFVPQMVNLDALDGINFTKGCYTGQEIVARTHYLGKVKRRTQLAHVVSPDLPQPGALVYAAGSTEPVGMVVSAAPAPGGGFDLLAEIRLESVEAGTVCLDNPAGPALELLSLPYPL